MAVSVCFKQSSSFKWKIKNPFSRRYLESEIFYFDKSKCKFSIGYSNMLDCFPFSLRKIHAEEPMSTFGFELFIQTDDRKLQCVTADNFRVVDCTPVTLWMPSRNYTRQLSNQLCTDNDWTFVFVLTSNTPPQDESERVCDCRERYCTYNARTIETKAENSKNKKSSNELSNSQQKYDDSELAGMEGLTLDLHRLLDEGTLSDVRLMCGELTIPAHKNILSARSEVFGAMLRTDMAESRSGLIEISDMEVPVFSQLVHFIYTGKLSDLSTDTASQLYMAGDKYAIESLKSQCSVFIKENLTVENACSILVLSDTHSDKDLKDCTISFILQNELPLIDDIWIPFSKNYPLLEIEVLRRAYKAKCDLT